MGQDDRVFLAFSPAVRINVAVVALGDTPRLRACLAALVAHQSSHEFTVTCVINPAQPVDQPIDGLPAGVHVLRPAANLGWSGGLHAARRETDGDFLAWVQEDMVINAGWLDALMAAAADHPRGGIFGAVGVDAEGHAVPINAGDAIPAETSAAGTSPIEPPRSWPTCRRSTTGSPARAR